jgi:hypothetical protein
MERNVRNPAKRHIKARDVLHRIWWRQIVRTLFGAVAFIALVVVLLGGSASAPGLAGTFGTRCIAACVAVAASAVLLRIGRLVKADPLRDERLGPENRASPSTADITDAMLQMSRKYKPEVRYLFQQILQDPTQYLHRINERVEAREGCLALDVTMDYAFDGQAIGKVSEARAETILIPLIKLKKHVMLDNLEMWDGDGHHVSALLQDEVNGLIASAVSNLFRVAFLSSEPDQVGRKLSDAEDRLLWNLIRLACHVGDVNPATTSAILRMLEDGPVESTDDGTAKASEDGVGILRNFCEFFADHYLIVVEAELPKGTQLSMRYSRTVPQYNRTEEWNDRIRVRLGLSPYRYIIPLRLPFDAPSYHFSMLGVQGQYLAHGELVDARTRMQLEPTAFSDVVPCPSLQARHGSGLPYAHIYTTGLHKAKVVDMYTKAEFGEIPPGALGGACVVSVACAILVWFFALTQPGLQKVLASPSDLPALLLTVPAFAATWIGQSVDRILRSSASAYMGLVISAVVSLASALLYVANSAGRSFYTIKSLTVFHGHISLKGVDISWFVLALVASVIAAYLAETLRDKVRSYMRAVKNGSQLVD